MAHRSPTALLWRFLFRRLGRRIRFESCGRLARRLAPILWRLGPRRSVVLKNLELAFPELTDRERERLGREATAGVLTVFFELLPLQYLTDDQLRRVIRFENPELLEAIGPEGGLLLSGHLGNWELLAFGGAALSERTFTIVVKEQRDFGELERMRTARGNRVVPTSRAARVVAETLKKGGITAMLADQSAFQRDHLVQLFGIPTYTFATPAKLALRYRPTVVVGFAHRRPDGTYTVRLENLRHDDLPDTGEGAVIFTQRYADLLEKAIRRTPEQWLWHHKKWKRTPGVSYDRQDQKSQEALPESRSLEEGGG